VYDSTRNTHLCITNCEHLERFDPCSWGHYHVSRTWDHLPSDVASDIRGTQSSATLLQKIWKLASHFASALPACVYSNFFFMVQQPLVGQCLLVIETSCSHSDTPHLIGLLWISDQSNAETSTWQYMTVIRDIHACGHWVRYVYSTLFHMNWIRQCGTITIDYKK